MIPILRLTCSIGQRNIRYMSVDKPTLRQPIQGKGQAFQGFPLDNKVKKILAVREKYGMNQFEEYDTYTMTPARIYRNYFVYIVLLLASLPSLYVYYQMVTPFAKDAPKLW